MPWDETKPLSAANLSLLQDDIDQANQNIIDAKTPIATAINVMGQAASSVDTFATLAAKIKDISNDATAEVSEVVAGKTIYQGGSKKTGTMVDRLTGNYTASGISRSGTTLRFAVPAIARYGTGSTIQYTDADFIARNIPEDINIFGLQGTLKRGKQVASGTTPTTGATGDETIQLVVSGLGFQPSRVFLNGNLSVRFDLGYGDYGFFYVNGAVPNGYNVGSSFRQVRASVSYNSGGFVITLSFTALYGGQFGGERNLNWYCHE